MKCPHCGYSHKEYDFDTKTSSEGEHGDFYRLPIKIEREEFYDHDANAVLGCPACKKVFMN